MSASPLVTVIIASYNHTAYVEASIRSVLGQTYPDIELLVVDDGSQDGSVARIEGLRERYGFDFRSQANKGLAATLNECVARARGDLICPFGSDDVMLPERIAVQVGYMDGRPEVGICAGNIETIDEKGRPVAKRNRERCFRRLSFEDIFLGRQPGAPAPTLMFRKEALEKVGGFDPAVRLEDLLVQLKIAQRGYAIDVLPDVLAQYRVHGTNTYKNHRFMVSNVLQTFEQFTDHPDYEKARSGFLNRMLVKCGRDEKELARDLLRQLPLRSWNARTIKGLWRMLASW